MANPMRQGPTNSRGRNIRMQIMKNNSTATNSKPTLMPERNGMPRVASGSPFRAEKAAREFARLVPRGAWAAEARQVSYLWFLGALRSSHGLDYLMAVKDGALDAKFKGGTQQIAQRLADALGERLAQLDAPLVKGVDPPDGALREDIMLVERDQFPERVRGQAFGQDDVGRPVAFADTEWRLRRVRPFRGKLFLRLAERQSLGLGEQVRHQEVVLLQARAQGTVETDEVAGDQLRALMDQLVK